MYDTYLVTGGSTPIGKGVVEALCELGRTVRVLVNPESDHKLYDELGVEVFEGETFDKDSMKQFFKVDDPRASVVLHVDELCNFSGEKNLDMRRINVAGTINVVDQVLKYKTGKMVYLSSAYALRDAGSDNPSIYFDRTKVEGDYAKTKAEASAYVMEKVSLNKLNCAILLPTFIMGPYHGKDTEMGRIIEKYLEKNVSPIDGGHAFVDIRDVINAVVVLADKGKRGEGYILTGEYKSADEFFSELSDAKGVDKIKKANKIVNSEKFAKFVDTYYKLTHKENPKEVYALFRNNPDVKFTSTIDKVMPDVEIFSVKDSIVDSFSDGPVAKAKSKNPIEEIVEEATEAAVEGVKAMEETAKEAIEEKADPVVVEAEAVVEEVVETPVEEVAEEVIETPVEETVEEIAEEPVEEVAEVVETVEEIAEESVEEVAEVVEEEIAEEVAEEVIEAPAEEVVEEVVEEVAETVEETAEVVEEAVEEVAAEPVVEAEEPAEAEPEAKLVPLWAQAPVDDNFEDFLEE